MTELRALIAALLLFEALHHAGVFSKEPRTVALLWAGLIAGAAGAGHRVFPGSTAFFPWLAVLFLVQLVRVKAGLLTDRSHLLERWRYAPAAAVGVLTGLAVPTAAAFLVLGASRRNLRAFLLLFADHRNPLGISSLDVDQIVPPPVTIEEAPREESGMAMVEAIVGLTLVLTLTGALYLAAAGRTARLRQVRDAAVAREAAVTKLETLGTVDPAGLLAKDGDVFEVPGGKEPGRVRVTEIEVKVYEVSVTVPRRGCAPVVLTTLRAGEARR